VLATVMFTDIVGSTEKAVTLGDGSGENCSTSMTRSSLASSSSSEAVT